jgi:hypothetical protein
MKKKSINEVYKFVILIIVDTVFIPTVVWYDEQYMCMRNLACIFACALCRKIVKLRLSLLISILNWCL